MKKQALSLVFCMLLLCAGCAPSAQSSGQTPSDGQQEESMRIVITAGDDVFYATAEQNETARAFAARLPLTLGMSELNGNEKYCYLNESLPSSPVRVGQISAGDLMLYGSSCIVLFYESFSTSYSYTRIGSVDDPAGLAQALGGGFVSVTFALSEE